MTEPITVLVTTFDTWLSHQVSNSSDDLVCLWQSSSSGREWSVSGREFSAESQAVPIVHVLHQLPVDASSACAAILQSIEQYQPDYVIICGMAESRRCLSLEVRAVAQSQDDLTSNADPTVYWTPISLTALCTLRRSLQRAEISYDAGRFVCNDTYYRLLKHHIETPRFPSPLFLHVPPLTPENRSDLLGDFQKLLRFLAEQRPPFNSPAN